MTVIHNVSGDVAALLGELKGAVGAGGLVREGDVEVCVGVGVGVGIGVGVCRCKYMCV